MHHDVSDQNVSPVAVEVSETKEDSGSELDLFSFLAKQGTGCNVALSLWVLVGTDVNFTWMAPAWEPRSGRPRVVRVLAQEKDPSCVQMDPCARLLSVVNFESRAYSKIK